MKQRIVAIDVLRGFALLGILLMNMSSYGMPNIAYFNPTTFGGDDIGNRLVFSLSHIFADQKMMALFSMLFGASVMLVTNNVEKKGRSPLRFHYVRNFWLMIFGLIHAILIWEGDILLVYALCSFVLYWLRKLPPRRQFLLGLSIFYLPSVVALGSGWTIPAWEAEDRAYVQSFWQPDDAKLQDELDRYRGDYAGQVDDRLNEWSSDEPRTMGQDILELNLLIEFFGRALGMMLIGMAFYTWGILTAQRSDEFYVKMVQIGFSVGIPLTLISLYLYTASDWLWSYALFIGRIPNHLATPFIACGYIGLVMLWSRAKVFVQLRDRLAAVGRMALTNYIGQSLISTLIFYGFGLGLFGRLNRAPQFGLILVIWGAQIMFSAWWLARFQYGPLEWAWRSLSHWRIQTLKQQAPTFKQM